MATTRSVTSARSASSTRTAVPASYAVTFDGATSKILSIRGGLTGMSTAFSILTRIKPSNVTGTFVLFANATGTNDRVSLSIFNGSLRGAYFNGAFVGAASTTSNLAVGTTYTVVYIFNGTTGQLLVNDVAQTNTSTPSTATTNALGIGVRNDGTTFYAGTMQGMHVIKRAISAAEATAYYANNVVPTNGLALSYRMLEGSGSASDSVGQTATSTALTWGSPLVSTFNKARFASTSRTAVS